MQVVSNVRRLSRAFKYPIFLNSDRFLAPDIGVVEAASTPLQCRNQQSFSSQTYWSSGMIQSNHLPPLYSVMPRACFSSKAITGESCPTETVKELYDKMLESVVVKRSMPPNAWLWSLLENCKIHDDIKLLFDLLGNLRKFRLSNLRIHANFNCNLCREITKTCVRVGALEFGKKALWKHNVYGLTPTVGSAHHLLLYAKNHNDGELMVEVMKLLKRNDLPLQPGTADIVFSICYNTDNWQLMSKYSKNFIKAGVKLRQTAFDLWMEFATKIGLCKFFLQLFHLKHLSMVLSALTVWFWMVTNGEILVLEIDILGASFQEPSDRYWFMGVVMMVNQVLSAGDTQTLWKVEKLRSESLKQHTIVSGFSCAKGFLLERKPEDAAAIIQLLNQSLSDARKSGIMVELQKLVNEWPVEVINHQKEADRKALAASLQSNIPAMVTGLLNMGIEASVNIEDLAGKEGILY
ncbi:hypothetical protein CJ030_MR5G017311 [Morella rubra]|uniref:Uncharacterized protein n=1 Tax=Morella rubra TaxID=262757 RepID=A0A6A1VR18_9ROSI|nr:hypothetical protein CJ030_MR5G017311 [Morella rubra]